MTFARLVFENLRHHRRAHAGAFLGAVAGVAALVGALGAGDSMRASLERIAWMRLGRAEYALASADRFFRTRLAEDLGVDARFWGLGREFASFPSPGPGEAVVNRALAARLNVKPGDEIVLRAVKPLRMPAEAPLAPGGGDTVALRAVVRAVARDAQLGAFDLRATQVTPPTAFLSLDWLARQAGVPDRSNVLLVAGRRGAPPPVEDLQGLLQERWSLEDAGLELRDVGRRTLELRSDRIFLEPAAEEAALAAGRGARGVLTYFANAIRCGERETPYSFVSAPGEPIVPPGTADDEILLTEWLAEDLGAVPGDRIELAYFVPGPLRRLEERTAAFRVREVVPYGGPSAERDLAPPVPGLAESETCSGWKPGFPIDLGRVRPKDEAYWKARRGAPKAFVTLPAARKLWGNRFGSLTAVRWSADRSELDALGAAILKKLPPSSLGLKLTAARAEARRASAGSTDFGTLFAGLSGFLAAAALLLSGLLFALGLEARAGEAGTLRAVGFTARQVRRLRLAEAAGVALLGGAAGAVAGVATLRLLLWGLGTVWIGAVGTASLVPRIGWASWIAGAAGGAAAAFLATAVPSLRLAARHPREL
ncbi:MAG: FtsX-like permease family protein, partial [Planctomycetes bacterium]|nr:FtsX-like permease family protein [Planctomycetota bacterium]